MSAIAIVGESRRNVLRPVTLFRDPTIDNPVVVSVVVLVILRRTGVGMLAFFVLSVIFVTNESTKNVFEHF